MSGASFQPYLVGTLAALGAILSLMNGAPTYAGGFALLAVVSLIQSRHFMSQAQKASHGVSEVEDTACAAQVFSTVDELSAGIAHEINNPLGIIAQETEWVQHLFDKHSLDALQETDDCKDSLREITRQVDRCKEIVQKLLSLARHMNPVIQSVDMNSVIRTMIDLVQREASEKNITILGRLDPELPLVSSDPPLLRQVFLNLLVNATQAVDKDGTITVTTGRATPDVVEVRVADNGCGIPPENLSKIFNPFFSTKGTGKGTGLGLAMCRGIVEKLGGHIAATSEPGRLTVFTVRLPVHRRVEGEQQHADHPESAHH
jgi:two-component system, NtrC family, sensor kinase